MEQYSKEFWLQCMAIHNPTATLSQDINGRLEAHCTVIKAWCDGVNIESCVCPKQGFVPLDYKICTFHPNMQFRIAPPKPIERDVVVYWRGALRNQPFHMSARIDVRLLCPPGTNEKAKTLAQLEEETPGFKLLSITRVVVDPTNHNLLEYTTKLDNLGRVPF